MTMIDIGTRQQLEALRDADAYRIHIAASGAGAGLQDVLWSVPGCSSFLSGASFPYARAETNALLGHARQRYADADAAVDLALTAYMHARRACEGRIPVGVGVAASVASREEHRGDHRVHVAVLTGYHEVVTSATLKKGAGDDARMIDGETVDLLTLAQLLDAVDLMPMAQLDHDRIFDRLTAYTRGDGSDGACQFAMGLLAHPLVLADGSRRPVADVHACLPGRLLVHPGTFSPPHVGHVEGARSAFNMFSMEGPVRMGAHPRRLVHAITLDPPNKPRVGTAEALDRAIALGSMGCDVLLSQGDPLFVDKAERMPGAAFVVGADTVVRMLDPQWGPSATEVLDRLMRAGATLYVVGRLVTNAQGATQFVTVEHPWITSLVPLDMRFMLRNVPGRWDVSSTELRSMQDNSAK